MPQRKADDLTHTDSLDLYPRQGKRSPMPQRPHRPAEHPEDALERGVSVRTDVLEEAREEEEAEDRPLRGGRSGRLKRQRSKAEQAGGAGLIVAVIVVVVVVVWLLLKSDSSVEYSKAAESAAGNTHHRCVSPCAAGVCRCGYEGQG